MNNFVLILLLIAMGLVIAWFYPDRSLLPMKSLFMRLPLSPNIIIDSAAAFSLKPHAISMDTCHD
jgi:hypothetical protein